MRTRSATLPNTGKLVATEASGPLPGARVALLLLLSINLFNLIDRQVLAAVEPDIRRDVLLITDENDPNAKFFMGLLSTAFLVTYMIAAPVFGWLSVRMSRWLLIGIGVAVWSLASGFSGLVTSYWFLLLTRCFVGIGEAAYGPVAPDMISDLYPVKQRGRVMAWFYMAIPVGGALGYALGGQTAISALGWRWAFYLVVPPGILLGLLCLLMREPARGLTTVRHGWAAYRTLLQTRSYVLDTLGMTAMCFTIGGLAYWMPAYLNEHKVASVGPIDARTVFGAITVLAGLTATLAGGIVGDKLRDRYPGSYFLVSGIAMLISCPMVLLILETPFPWAWVWVFLAVFCLFFNTGPTNTILANVTHPQIRATAFALNILVIHGLGDAISPPVIGLISGYTSTAIGFVVMAIVGFLGGCIWILGAPHLERDTELAPQRLGEIPY